jgi:hypothetical protein
MKYEIKVDGNVSVSNGNITTTTTDTNYTKPRVLEVQEFEDSILITYTRQSLVTSFNGMEAAEVYKIQYGRYDGTKTIK